MVEHCLAALVAQFKRQRQLEEGDRLGSRSPALRTLQTGNPRESGWAVPLSPSEEVGQLKFPRKVADRKDSSMQGDRETIDVVVHSEDQVSQISLPARIDGNQLLMRGALIDPEVPARINVALDTALSTTLAGGAHVERGRDWSVEIHEEALDVSWQIETIDLGDGFRLHDVRAKSPEGPIRAFGIEDLAASIGVGVAGAISVYLLWRSHKQKQEDHAQERGQIAAVTPKKKITGNRVTVSGTKHLCRPT